MSRIRPAARYVLALRRYRRRWVVERTIGWLGNTGAWLCAMTARSKSTGRYRLLHDRLTEGCAIASRKSIVASLGLARLQARDSPKFSVIANRRYARRRVRSRFAPHCLEPA